MTKEQAKSTLILVYGIKEPTDEQIAQFILFGEVHPNSNANA